MVGRLQGDVKDSEDGKRENEEILWHLIAQVRCDSGGQELA